MKRRAGWIRKVAHGAGVTARGLGVLLVFGLALVAGVLAHLDLPRAKRFTVAELNGVLASTFVGTVTIEEVSRLSVFGASGVRVRVKAAGGRTLLYAQGVRAAISPLAIARSELFGHGPLAVDVSGARVDFVEASLDTDERGDLMLGHAFDPRTPSPPSTTPGRGLRLAFSPVALVHAWLHGDIPGAPPIDVDLDGLRGALLVAPDVTRVDVTELALGTRALPMGADVRGGVRARASFYAAPDQAPDLEGSFDGEVGEIPANVRASMVKGTVDAVLDVPEASAARVRARMTTLPVYESVSGHVEAHGPLARVRLSGAVAAGPGRVGIDGDVSAADDPNADVRIEATNIDARAFTASGPHSSLGAVVDLRVKKPKSGPIRADFGVDVPPGRYGDQLVPGATARGDATENTDRRWGPLGLSGHLVADVAEQGAPVHISAEASPSPGGERIGLRASSDVQLDRVRRVAIGRGRARLDAEGVVVLCRPPAVDVGAHLTGHGLSRGQDRAARVDVKVLAKGSALDPALKSTVSADGVDVAGYHLAHVGVAADGRLARQEVMLVVRGERGTPSVEGQALVDVRPDLGVRAGRLWVSRGADTLLLRVDRVKVSGADVTVEGATLDGLGSVAHASLRKTAGRLKVRADAPDLDLTRLGHVLRMEDTIRGGHISLDVDLDARTAGATGHANVVAKDVVVSSVDGGSADVHLTMKGRQIEGGLRVALAKVASLDVRSDGLQVGGHGPLDLGAWRKAWGKVRFSAQGDAAALAARLPPDALPFSEISGGFTLRGEIERDGEGDDTPAILFTADTRGLVLGTRSGPVETRGAIHVVSPPASRTAGVDAQLDVRVDGTSGFTEVAARLVDRRGALLGLDAKSEAVPYKKLLASFDGAAAMLSRIPVSVSLVIPSRKLEELPPWIALPESGGVVEGTIDLTGTVDVPRVVARVHGRGLRVRGMHGARLDADLAAAYDGAKGQVELHARSPAGEVLAAAVALDARSDGVLLGRGDLGAWTASASAKLTRFPLAALGPLSDRQVEGYVSGDVALDGLRRDARAKIALTLDDLLVGSAKYDRGLVTAELGTDGLSAEARLQQGAGFADAKARVGMTWGDKLAPAVDPKGKTELSLQAKTFSIAALLPLLQGQVSEIDGKLDADAHYATQGGGAPTMQGSAALRDGLLQVDALGEELHAVRGKVTLSPDGQVRVEDVSLSGPSGKITASGSARLEGLSLASAEARIKIAKKEALPLDLSGASLGQVYGDVAVKATASPDRRSTTVAVDIPSLHVDLPLTSVTTVTSLDVPKDEHVGYFKSPDRFVITRVGPSDAAPKPTPEEAARASVLDLKVHLGEDVEIRRGTTLRVSLAGDPSVHVAGETVVKGQLHLRSGALEVQGKKFEIEKGTVTFVGKDPGNPEVSVTAGWTAEDGTRVYADFVGPLLTGKVTLRSEPARPNNEIVALILFGTADGSQSTPYASPSEDNATRVGTTAGGFATEGLSKGLDQLTGMEIQTKIDTSNSANPRPEVEVQIAKDISVQLAFVLGTPPPGMNPDTTYASIDWRFLRNWSLETTFGNLGSTIADVIWQYRY